MHPQLGHLIVKNVRGKGRGVFTTKAIKKGDIVEVCPVIPFSVREASTVMGTILGHYVFEWGKACRNAALPLGYGAVYNHSPTPNIYYRMREAKNQIVFRALRDIQAGEELLSNYFYYKEDYKKPLDEWLERPQVYQ